MQYLIVPAKRQLSSAHWNQEVATTRKRESKIESEYEIKTIIAPLTP